MKSLCSHSVSSPVAAWSKTSSSRTGGLAMWLAGGLCLLSLSVARGENWAGWRGPRGDGTSLEKNIPTKWSSIREKVGTETVDKRDNIAWKVEVPGVGHSSPIVFGNRIYVQSCREDQKQRVLLCFDRLTGGLVWERNVLTSPLEMKHKLNSFASATPATDGELIYATFLDGLDMVVAAFDTEGEKKWEVKPGAFSSRHGYCSSPVIYKDRLIVNGDHDGNSYIVALDRLSGKTLWKTPREFKTRSYVTPLMRTIDGREQLILSGSKCVASYDPADGSQHWMINGPTEQFVASMVYDGNYLFLTAGFPQRHVMAIRPDGKGNVSSTHVAWHHEGKESGAGYVPSPIVEGKYYFVCSDDGIISCFDTATGTRHYRERGGNHYSTAAVSAEGLVYLLADNGITLVIRPGKTLDIVSKNEIDENCYASPAISQGNLYIRSEKHLYCIGPQPK